MNLFRIRTLDKNDLEAFHRDGYLVFPDVLTCEAREGLITEMLSIKSVVEFFNKTASDLQRLGKPFRLSVKPWNEKGRWSFNLLDAPFVRTLLHEIIGTTCHFCHSSLAVSCPGAKGIQFHQDHHHWFNDSPLNHRERNRWYLQMLYYPNGFNKGDGCLSVLPGSHQASPLDFPAERLAENDFGPFEPEDLEVPPGTMVLLNARVFHRVSPQHENSTQKYRLFTNYIYKEAGPPHLNTQKIPRHWLKGATAFRKTLLQRPPYSPGCWDDDGQ